MGERWHKKIFGLQKEPRAGGNTFWGYYLAGF